MPPTTWNETWTEITTEAELRELVAEPLARTHDKDRAVLHPLDREWIAASPLCLLATADAEGRCDISPRGDPPGFVHVLDDRTIAVPERPGNRRVDSYRNVLANPHIGLLFVLPGRDDLLRVNGRARIVRDAEFFDDMVVRGHRPVLALVMDVEEAFHHCSKAFLRAELWDPSTWTPDAVTSRARIAKALERPDEELAELERYYGPDYARQLYGG